MPYLALILFAPWFLILGALFWLYPRQPRTSARRLFDAATLVVAGGGSFYGMNWAYLSANTQVGMEWKQIFAALVAYGVFLGVMTAALVVRHRMLRARQA
ncbi:MAG TPA: hypothetical protein VK753_01540 [Xanthomonadaceae bacterium]|jgi:hypothetical protein|nr:hypothetical protein [Xanthomonadaceae bacterium]